MKLWNDERDYPNWGITFVSLSAIVGIMAFWIVLASVIWGLRVATAGIYGRGEARIQIQSAANRIQAYDHFFNLCAAVQADEAALNAQAKQLIQLPPGRDYNRTLANIAGITANRQRSIAQYNADARKDYTIGQFRDSDLPYQLSTAAYPEGGGTSCES